MNENIKKIVTIIQQVKPSLQNLSEDTILNQGALDSLDIITVVALLEKEFQLNISGVCLKKDNFETAQTLWMMIEKIKGETKK